MITARPSLLLHRRQLLQFGSAAMLLGGTLPAARPTGQQPTGFGKARSVLMIYASGGQSHIDMWDPKPDAPDHVRGIFRPISTSVPGLQFTEHMPGIAGIADRITVIRSMSHEDLDHGSATYLSLTGRYHQQLSSNPPPRSTDLPTLGAILERVPFPQRFFYDSIHVNGPALVPFEPSPGQYGGLLGQAYDPLVIGDVTEGELAIPGLTAGTRLSDGRMASRADLKKALDASRQELLNSGAVQKNEKFYSQAMSLLSSRKVRDAFDLNREPARLRDAYGRHRSGQACLLARRLIEVGVPFVNVIWNHSNRGQDREPDVTDDYGWDTHNDIFYALKDQLLPRFDQTLPALIKDMDRRGLLDETLVICMGEFGRAPLVAREPNFIGNKPGRKHWANAYSIVMAGAGVGRGQVVGATNRTGGDVITDRFGPWDVAATLFHALGIDPAGHYTDPLDRPQPISVGKPMIPIYR
jgi:hypothetical protein